MNIKIKICGLTRECDIGYVNDAKPDYVGFVFAKSKRQIGRAEAEKMKEKLDGEIQAVGVFVDAPVEEVISLVKGNVIDMVQLHGRESPLYVKELKERAGCMVIKAFHPEEGCKERETYDMYREAGADYFLFDSGGNVQRGNGAQKENGVQNGGSVQRGNSVQRGDSIQRGNSVQRGGGIQKGDNVRNGNRTEIGGTGRAFCWDLIPKIPYPYFLAGGICIGNVEEAMRTALPRPYGLDISSGVESEGVKDKEKILEIVRRIRNG